MPASGCTLRSVTTLPEIVIASFEVAEDILRAPKRDGVRFLVSIGEPGSDYPAGYHRAPIRRMRMEFDDVTVLSAEAAGYLRADRSDIEKLVKFLEKVEGKILFHCAAGISRSAASAVIFAAMKLGPGKEAEACKHIHKVKHTVYPNKHVIRLGDEILGREKKLLRAAFAEWPEPPVEEEILGFRVTGPGTGICSRCTKATAECPCPESVKKNEK
jgi:predicted protein tyrosine phosphatase